MRRISRGTSLSVVVAAGTLTLLSGVGMAAAASNSPTSQSPALISSTGQSAAGQSVDAPTPGDVRDPMADASSGGDVKAPASQAATAVGVKGPVVVRDLEDAGPAKDRAQIQSGGQASRGDEEQRSDERSVAADRGFGHGDLNRGDAGSESRGMPRE